VHAAATYSSRDRGVDSDGMLSDMAIRHADRLMRAECVLVGVRVAG
jgi:hypothetical protein